MRTKSKCYSYLEDYNKKLMDDVWDIEMLHGVYAAFVNHINLERDNGIFVRARFYSDSPNCKFKEFTIFYELKVPKKEKAKYEKIFLKQVCNAFTNIGMVPLYNDDADDSFGLPLIRIERIKSIEREWDGSGIGPAIVFKNACQLKYQLDEIAILDKFLEETERFDLLL